MRKIVFCLLATTLLITGCNSNKKDEAAGKKDNGSSVETKQERNKKIIMASMESFMKGDLDGTFKDVASNFVDKIDGTVPPVTNVDTLKSFMKMLEASIEGYKGENLRYYADSDYVLVYGEWGGLFKNNMGTIKATGKPVTFRDIDMFKLNDEGKVVEHSSIQNLNAVLMAASMMK